MGRKIEGSVKKYKRSRAPSGRLHTPPPDPITETVRGWATRTFVLFSWLGNGILIVFHKDIPSGCGRKNILRPEIMCPQSRHVLSTAGIFTKFNQHPIFVR
jgi:hypothetical protein